MVIISFVFMIVRVVAVKNGIPISTSSVKPHYA
jgi:hypothetical protein